MIKDKAKVLFFQKGLLDATTQEIADEAGVNRALIHYYFRSREQLMETLLEEVMLEKQETIREILKTEHPFKIKIAKFIGALIDHGLKYPYLENFVISETARNPDRIKLFRQKEKNRSHELVRQQLEEEISKGNIDPITAQNFMINLISLCNYPLLAKTVIQCFHGMNDTEYRKFLVQRKQVIYKAIFNEEMPDVE
nr:TetR/AcrR family transcriptional regulator [Chryseosolibacter indicus]